MTSSPANVNSPSESAQASFNSWLSDARYRRILSAVVSGGAARILSSALTLIALPLAVRYLGPERYGVWATVASIAVWMNLLDLGIANSLTNAISGAFARHDDAEAARAFTNALAVTCGAAALVGSAFLLIAQRMNWVAAFKASAQLSNEIRWTLMVAVLIMLAGLPLNLISKVLTGYQELHTYNKAVATGAVCSLLGLACGVWLRVSMPVLFLLSFGAIALVNCALFVWVVGWHKPWLRPQAKYLSLEITRELLSSGWAFLLIQIAAIVVFSSDNIVVAHYLGAAEVTPYSVTWRVVGLGTVLQALLFPALWPAYAEAQARGDATWIRRTFSGVMRGTLIANVAWAVLLIAFGRVAIRWWAGPAAVPPLPLITAMAFWGVIGASTTAQSCLLGALNRIRAQAILSVIAAGVNLAISLALVTRIGSLGVILGTIISYVVVLMVPQTLIVSSALRDLKATVPALMAKPVDEPTAGAW